MMRKNQRMAMVAPELSAQGKMSAQWKNSQLEQLGLRQGQHRAANLLALTMIGTMALGGCGSSTDATPTTTTPTTTTATRSLSVQTSFTPSSPQSHTPTPSPTATANPSTHQPVMLPEPMLDKLLPSGLEQVEPNAATGQIATPTNVRTNAYAAPDGDAVLSLSSDTDELLNMPAHWAVVGTQDGWVQILTPVGRGSVPSKDASDVNHHTVWVKAEDVTLNDADYKIEVDTKAFTLTVTGPEGPATFHVGVGVYGKTDTPKGLCTVVGPVTIQSGEPGLLTNCQSEMVDKFEDADDAATAIHVYDPLGFDPAVGGDVSNGCIRVPQDAFEAHLADIPAGTPVVIN